jgi:hypothetical protein
MELDLRRDRDGTYGVHPLPDPDRVDAPNVSQVHRDSTGERTEEIDRCVLVDHTREADVVASAVDAKSGAGIERLCQMSSRWMSEAKAAAGATGLRP